MQTTWRMTIITIAALLSFSAESHADVTRRTALVRAVEKASPAVVNINTEQTVQYRRNPFFSFDTRSLLEDFFAESFGKARVVQQNVPLSLGSGVIIDPTGHVLTNEHVIVQASKIKVTLQDKRTFDAVLVGADPTSDLAVLHIQQPKEASSRKSLPWMRMGSSSDLMIGEDVIAIGNPFGLSHTVTRGVVSALGRKLKRKDRVYEDFIQTDASINPGNSGGPLLNIKGELIGINTAIYDPRKSQGIGFAIPIDFAKRVVDDLIRFGKVPPVWLGFQVKVEVLRPRASGSKPKKRLVVSQVDANGPSASAGLKVGDRLEAINRVQVNDLEGFNRQITRLTSGANVRLALERTAKRFTLNFRAGAFEPKLAEKVAREKLGIAVKITRRYVIVTRVYRGSAASEIGLAPGDLILAINNRKLSTIDEFRDTMYRLYTRNSAVMVVQRGASTYYVPLNFSRRRAAVRET